MWRAGVKVISGAETLKGFNDTFIAIPYLSEWDI